MSVVVQSSYRPQIAAGVVGMIADEASAEVMTRICETSAGIGFGLAVSQGSLSDKGCIIGGSAAGFLGISVRDITLDRVAIDPSATDYAAADTYPKLANMAVLTRGNIWVLANNDVAAGDALYFEGATGIFGNSSSGVAAQGSIVFTEQPAATKTVTIDGTAVTFGTDVQVGPTLGDTIDNLVAFLNASADSNISLMKFAADPPSPGGAGEGSGANTLLIGAKAAGTGGNAYTLATNVDGATLSGSTLSGGAATGLAVTGGYWKTSALAGQIAKVSLGIQR